MDWLKIKTNWPQAYALFVEAEHVVETFIPAHEVRIETIGVPPIPIDDYLELETVVGYESNRVTEIKQTYQPRRLFDFFDFYHIQVVIRLGADGWFYEVHQDCELERLGLKFYQDREDAEEGAFENAFSLLEKRLCAKEE
jgi:hypothetical protein